MIVSVRRNPTPVGRRNEPVRSISAAVGAKAQPERTKSPQRKARSSNVLHRASKDVRDPLSPFSQGGFASLDPLNPVRGAESSVDANETETKSDSPKRGGSSTVRSKSSR